ncbi:MAG: DNA gyrase subunit A [Phycisphaerales bacterium]
MSDTPSSESGPDGPANPDDAGTEPIAPSRNPIVERPIDRELHESYLTYAMSTIMDRALPDVRDGLKPSQRRILVAMNDLNLSPGRKHRKCAKIAGDTSGNYHPHGESVIYPTLVNMGQDWKMRVLLVDKQGNFGSIDGDPPAAMRYTEARLTAAAVDMLADIKLDTVDFKSNYDETRLEPTVLPAKFPNLLVNGSSGIAVGMASSIPPHNLGEICDAIVATLDNPDIELSELMEMVPGPDFATGGIIQGRRGILDAYSTGRGRIQLRGRVHMDKMNGRDVLIIDEIPYQLVQKNLIEKIVDAAKNQRIPDISDIKNFSGKSHRTRIVVYLKKGANPEVVEKQLYQYTPLQSTFSIINIALDHGRPRTMGLRQLIQAFIDHRRIVIRRRTEHLLREARKQAHRLEGLIYAVCDIDEVIRLIRASRTREEAIERLMDRGFQIPRDHAYAPKVPEALLKLSEEAATTDVGGIALTRVQAEAIGALRLIQLVGLEIERLVSEYSELLSRIHDYEAILGDDARVRTMIREDCQELKDKYATPRLTTIEDAESEDIEIGDLIAEHECVVTISHAGYVKRMPVDTYREQGRGGRGIKGSDSKDGDFIEHLLVSSSHDDLLCFTNTGRVFKKKVFQIPEMSRTSLGRAIVNLLELREDERIVAFQQIQDFEKSEDYLFFGTASGRVKRTALKDFRNVNRSGIIAVNLNDDDKLIDVVYTRGDDHVLLATAMGMAIRFNENDARVMGRSAAGVKGIDLANGDSVVGLVRAEDDSDLLTVTERGYGKRTPLNDYLVHSESGDRPQSRGGKGRRDIRTTDRNGPIAAILRVTDADGIMFVSEGGMIVRISAASVSQMGRNTQGVRVVNLKDGDRLISAARVDDGGDEDEIGGEGDEQAAGATDAPNAPEASE